DGPPARIFAEHGADLAARGVWVPGHRVPARPAATAPGPALLHARQVSVRGRLGPTDLRVHAGEALAVVGANGAGKSTLALLLGGLLPPDAGRVEASTALAGDLAGTAPHRWRAARLSTRIGSVFQNPEHQFVTARVADELALGPRRVGRPEAGIQRTVADLLSRLRLDALAGANPYTLSGGEARRLSVATALATAPRLLVLDEPTFGQDRRTWIELLDLLAGLRDTGHGVLAVTHDADFVTALADRRTRLEPAS
ncbi:MAG TPA: ABC transporter ATP-binding protein, partial [Catenuloplanes sp.]